MKEVVVVVVGENIAFVVSLVVRNKKGSISRKELYSNEFWAFTISTGSEPERARRV